MKFDYLAGRTEPENGSFFDTGDVKLWYHDDGADGEPVVLLGGFTAGHFCFDFIRPHMSGYRLLTWEPRGLGRSDRLDPAENEYSIAVWADDLHDLLSGLGMKRTHLWAGGFGSYIALRYAAEYPTSVGAIVTYSDVWAGDPAKKYLGSWEVYWPIVKNFGTTGFGARVLANIFDVSDRPWFSAWEAKNIEEVLHPETVEATVGYCLLHADVRSDLPSIQSPVLVLQGDRSWDGTTLDPSQDLSVQLMQKHIPQLEIVSIENTHPGYFLVQEPRKSAAAARAFLQRHPIGPTAP